MNEVELQKLFFKGYILLDFENFRPRKCFNKWLCNNYGWTEKFILKFGNILKTRFKVIQGQDSREEREETSGGFVKTWHILPKTKSKSLLPSLTKS